MAQLSLYLRVSFHQEFKSSMKAYFERVRFLTETGNRKLNENPSSRIRIRKKNPQSMKTDSFEFKRFHSTLKKYTISLKLNIFYVK